MHTFQELGLAPSILEAIELMGFEEPTEIQAKAIPHILSSNQDLIALAQTGTGKTGAFGLPCIQKIDEDALIPQLLILSPTRELALQTAKELKKFSKKNKRIKSVAVYGGADIGSQSRALRNGCHIVVGTPGRTLDFVRRGKLKLASIQMVVLDEADEMLKMGFQEDLELILSETPEEKQVLLFSATMPKTIERIARNYMSDSIRISIGKRNIGAKNVHHSYYLINQRDRYEALKRLVDVNPSMYGIIFCRTKQETVDICTQLRKDGYGVDLLNGDLSQKQRDHVMGQFRRKQLQVLVATDVASRGLDVHDLSHIISFNLPDDLEVYVHRSGRTGRAGKKGKSLCLVTSRDTRRLKSLEKMVDQTFHKALIPSKEEIAVAQLSATFDELERVEVPEEMMEQYAALIEEKLSQYTPKEVVARLLSVMCGQMLHSYHNALDLNERARMKLNKRERGRQGQSKRSRGRGERSTPRTFKKERVFEGNFTRCRINLGRQNGLKPHRLMGLVNENYEGKKPDFGKIDIQKQVAYFDIDTKAVSKLVKGFQGKRFEGRRIELIVEQ